MSQSSREGVLAAEQVYFDRAYERRERQREGLRQAPSAGVHKGAISMIKKTTDRALEKLRGPSEAVAFGRFDKDSGEIRYIGYNAIWDEERNVLVANWKADVAIPWFEASHADPQGLRLRRAFECEVNTVISFDDVVFKRLAEDVARLMTEPRLDDALLADPARQRTGEMQDGVSPTYRSQCVAGTGT